MTSLASSSVGGDKNSIIVIKEVPAQICNNCGDYFLSSEITKSVLAIAENAVKKGVEVEILKYVA